MTKLNVNVPNPNQILLWLKQLNDSTRRHLHRNKRWNHSSLPRLSNGITMQQCISCFHADGHCSLHWKQWQSDRHSTLTKICSVLTSPNMVSKATANHSRLVRFNKRSTSILVTAMCMEPHQFLALAFQNAILCPTKIGTTGFQKSLTLVTSHPCGMTTTNHSTPHHDQQTASTHHVSLRTLRWDYWRTLQTWLHTH